MIHTVAEDPEDGFGVAPPVDMADMHLPLDQCSLVGFVAAAQDQEIFCLCSVETEVEPFDQNCASPTEAGSGSTWTSRASQRFVDGSVVGMADQKTAVMTVCYCLELLDDNDVICLAEYVQIEDSLKLKSPRKVRAGKKVVVGCALPAESSAAAPNEPGSPTLLI